MSRTLKTYISEKFIHELLIVNVNLCLYTMDRNCQSNTTILNIKHIM